MDYSRGWFMIRYTADAHPATWWAYRLSQQDANPHSEQKLMTVQRNLQGKLISVVPALVKPRGLIGYVRAPGAQGTVAGTVTDEVSQTTVNVIWGGLADLRTAYYADSLDVLAWNDSAIWTARWLDTWEPRNLDPVGNWFVVPIQLEQVE